MPPRHTPSFRRTAMAATALSVLAALLSGGAAVAAPQYTLEERAFAIAGPSLVYLELTSKGILRRKDNGEPLHSVPFVVTYRCTGFVVSEAGHVVSITRCASPDPEAVRSSAINQLVTDRIKVGAVTQDQKDAYTRNLLATVEFTGEAAGSKPDQKLFGQLFQGQTGLSAEPAMQAEVVAAEPPADTDLTLLKLPLAGLPVAELTQEQVNTTSPVVLASFGSDNNSPTFTSKYKQGRITGRIGTKTPALYQLDSDLGAAAHGGMVLDSSGRVMGMVGTDPNNKDRINRVLVNVESIKGLLTKANVSNGLSKTDGTYRTALNDYFGGRYSDAISKFDSIIAVRPDHSTAILYRKQAADRLTIEGDASKPGIAAWILAVIGLLVVALLASFGIIIWMVRRRPVQHAVSYAPVSALPVSAYPISGLPISGAGVTYDFQPALGSEGGPQQGNVAHQEPYQGGVFLFPQNDGGDQHGNPRPRGDNDNPWAPNQQQ